MTRQATAPLNSKKQIAQFARKLAAYGRELKAFRAECPEFKSPLLKGIR